MMLPKEWWRHHFDHLTHVNFLVKPKDVFVLYQLSSDLDEVNRFYSSFSDKSHKPPPVPFKSLKKPAWYRVKNCWFLLEYSKIVVDNVLYDRIDATGCQSLYNYIQISFGKRLGKSCDYLGYFSN